MQRLLVFFIRYYSIFLFLLLEGIAFWLIKEHTYYQGAKITSATNQTTGFIHGKIQSIIDYFNLKEENQRLALENMQLKNKSSDAFQFMTIQHNSISDTAHKLNYQYITAKVVYNSLAKRDNYIMINIGKDQGIVPDMGVITSEGVVGTIIDVSSHYSLIMSVLHKNNKVSVKIKKNNTIGSLIWEGGSYKTAMMTDVPSHVDIKKGDTIVTSGYSGGFPENITVGTVKKVLQDKGVGLEVEINLSIDMSKISHVYVIQDYYKAEKDSLFNIENKKGISAQE